MNSWYRKCVHVYCNKYTWLPGSTIQCKRDWEQRRLSGIYIMHVYWVGGAEWHRARVLWVGGAEWHMVQWVELSHIYMYMKGTWG